MELLQARVMPPTAEGTRKLRPSTVAVGVQDEAPARGVHGLKRRVPHVMPPHVL